jgi:GGDEF domain-containing protein
MTNFSKKVTRMRMLSSLPGRKDFADLLQMASNQAGTTVQLPWVNEAKQESMTLSCCLSKSGGDPEWTLTSGFGIHSTPVWTYSTGDIDLIENMMFMETSGGGEPKPPPSFADLSELLRDPNAPSMQQQRLQSAPMGMDPSMGMGTGMGMGMGTGMPKMQPVMMERPKPAAHTSLQGSLSEMQVAGLLQSISINKMTGLLNVKDGEANMDVFFEDGMPLHAVSPQSNAEGDFAVLDLLTWVTGSFQFIPLERTAERTIHRRLEGILMEGAALVDQHQYLTKKGLKLNTYLMRKNLNLSEQEFEQALKDAAPIDMNFQKAMYTLVDHRNTLADVLRIRPLVKAEWVPVMYNLVSSNLVELSDRPTLTAKQTQLEEIGVDQAAVDGAYKAILRQESGMLSYQLFLHFLEQEFVRFQYSRSPFSLLVFDVRVRASNGAEEPIAGNGAKLIADLLKDCTRPIDVLGHFRSLEYGIILPFTDVSGATIFASKLAELFKAVTLPKGQGPHDTFVSFGVAGIPQDCQNLGTLVSAAVEAKRVSRETQSSVVAFKSLYKK